MKPDGLMAQHVEISGHADFWNEIVIVGRDSINLNSIEALPISGVIVLTRAAW